jgi:CRISPR-associated endonuclease/helicase Cas3
MSISFEWNKDVLYAHPGEPLEQHLLAVAHRTRELIHQAGASPFREQLAFLTGLCHDLAKATEDFQDYLYCSSHGQKWSGDADLKSHGRLGTLFCLAFGETLVEATAGDKLAKTLEVWLAALAIRSHHGRLHDFTPPESFVLPAEVDFEEDDEKFTLINKQLQRLRRPHFDRLLQHPDVPALLTPQQVIDTIASRETWLRWRLCKRRKLDAQLRDRCGMEAWAFLKLIYGCLLQADKEQNLPQRLARAFFPTLEIARYAQSLSAERPIERIRRDLFATCSRYAETVDLNVIHFHQLTLPTGAGKTLAGLQVAATIRHRLEAHGKQPRIVYALPFLSIIDQNFKVFQNVFGENTGDLLLAHHHLADLDFKYYDEQLDPVSAAFKIDGWEAELIVTTFHQLFATLFDTANSANRRFAALQNAIIILDEPQALPPAYLRLIRGALKAMAQALEWQVIVMTATPPLLFDPADTSCRQIVPTFREVFAQFNRYQLFDERKRIQSIPALVDAVENEWQQGSRRILVVANTVNAAKEIHASLKSFAEKYGVERHCLTTEILPIHRLEKINNIGGKAPVIAVSTQLIEAGVDISLDVVFRDFAPLPSLIQSAGRCRRHEWQECRGRVVLTHLGADETKPHANRIYAPVLLQMTESVLQVGEEKSLWPMIQAFYERMQEAISQDEAMSMLEDLRQLELKRVSMDFDLIPETGKRRDLLILYDDDAHQYYEQWQELGQKVRREKKLEEVFRLLALRRKVWRKLAQYLIHPFEKRLPESLREREEELVVVEDDIDAIYSKETGLIKPETDDSAAAGSIFC